MTDQAKPPAETPAEWLRFADENLAVAEYALTSAEPGYHTICFLSQSAAEKYLKAYLIARGWKLERTHDIVALLGLCADHDPSFAEIMSSGAVLNAYIVAGRYPGDLAFDEVTYEDAHEAVAIVRRIKQLVTA